MICNQRDNPKRRRIPIQNTIAVLLWIFFISLPIGQCTSAHFCKATPPQPKETQYWHHPLKKRASLPYYHLSIPFPQSWKSIDRAFNHDESPKKSEMRRDEKLSIAPPYIRHLWEQTAQNQWGSKQALFWNPNPKSLKRVKTDTASPRQSNEEAIHAIIIRYFTGNRHTWSLWLEDLCKEHTLCSDKKHRNNPVCRAWSANDKRDCEAYGPSTQQEDSEETYIHGKDFKTSALSEFTIRIHKRYAPSFGQEIQNIHWDPKETKFTEIGGQNGLQLVYTLNKNGSKYHITHIILRNKFSVFYISFVSNTLSGEEMKTFWKKSVNGIIIYENYLCDYES